MGNQLDAPAIVPSDYAGARCTDCRGYLIQRRAGFYFKRPVEQLPANAVVEKMRSDMKSFDPLFSNFGDHSVFRWHVGTYARIYLVGSDMYVFERENTPNENLPSQVASVFIDTVSSIRQNVENGVFGVCSICQENSGAIALVCSGSASDHTHRLCVDCAHAMLQRYIDDSLRWLESFANAELSEDHVDRFKPRLQCPVCRDDLKPMNLMNKKNSNPALYRSLQQLLSIDAADGKRRREQRKRRLSEPPAATLPSPPPPSPPPARPPSSVVVVPAPQPQYPPPPPMQPRYESPVHTRPGVEHAIHPSPPTGGDASYQRSIPTIFQISNRVPFAVPTNERCRRCRSNPAWIRLMCGHKVVCVDCFNRQVHADGNALIKIECPACGWPSKLGYLDTDAAAYRAHPY